MNDEMFFAMRTQALSQFTSSGENPEDLLIVIKGSDILGLNVLPYQDDFKPSMKYSIRKKVVESIISRQLTSTLNIADKVYLFSFEPIYNVDYAFVINLNTNRIDLSIIKDGNIIKKYPNFMLNYDERNDLMFM